MEFKTALSNSRRYDAENSTLGERMIFDHGFTKGWEAALKAPTEPVIKQKEIEMWEEIKGVFEKHLSAKDNEKLVEFISHRIEFLKDEQSRNAVI